MYYLDANGFYIGAVTRAQSTAYLKIGSILKSEMESQKIKKKVEFVTVSSKTFRNSNGSFFISLFDKSFDQPGSAAVGTYLGDQGLN